MTDEKHEKCLNVNKATANSKILFSNRFLQHAMITGDTGSQKNSAIPDQRTAHRNFSAPHT